MVKEMSKFLGQVVLVKDGPVAYEATITDVKMVWGSELYKVVPVAGCGSKWVKDFVGKSYPGSFNGAKNGERVRIPDATCPVCGKGNVYYKYSDTTYAQCRDCYSEFNLASE